MHRLVNVFPALCTSSLVQCTKYTTSCTPGIRNKARVCIKLEMHQSTFSFFFFFIYTLWAFHGNLWAKGGTFLWYLLSESPPAREPLPRVRKPNLYSDRGQDSNPRAWRPLGPQSALGPTEPQRPPTLEVSRHFAMPGSTF